MGEISAFDVKTLLGNNDKYVIPIYQRNYAWEAKEIEQLIQDIIDYSKHHSDKNYYIGTLVVADSERNGVNYLSTIDGQQRLTTLTILSTVLKNHFASDVDMTWFNQLNLSFESREKSENSLKAAFAGNFEISDSETNIKNAYQICKNELSKKLPENNISLTEFTEYLYKYVKILRVPLPKNLDLNHYFEIMNSRGEQLEKHEILKAKLMSVFYQLPDRVRHETLFDLIWEACSNMEKYVQYGFSVEQRHVIFGNNDWNNLALYSFDELLERLNQTLDSNTTTESNIDDILQGFTDDTRTEVIDDSPDRFNSVINFQNFLLHVLRVQIKKDDIALDDKRLIDIFEKEMHSKSEKENIEFVKEFIYNLLKAKFLFDKYVIKREFTANTDRWSLKSLKWYSSGKTKNGVKYVNTFGDESNESFDSDNRRILMLLSMFHVSIPSMSYKYWLNASLNYLMEQIDIDSRDYINYLEHIAKSFVYDRFLSNNPKDYFEMIYLNNGPVNRSETQLNFEKLKYGTIENNLVFNYCDYLLWLQLKNTENDARVKAFEYTFRSSVEHYYPQNPINVDAEKLEEKYLHQFGNLCLISHEKNSRLNNFLPAGKKEFYSKSATIDSLKQYLMMKYTQWEIKDIENHNHEMNNLLIDNLCSNYQKNHEVSKAIKWFNEFKVRDKKLLVRALLSFDDCTYHLGRNRYFLYNFDYIRNHNAFQQFENYIETTNVKSLDEIIKKRITFQSVKNSWQYTVVKHRELLEYCQEGIIDWNEDSNGKLVFIVQQQKNSTNSAVECYSYLLKIWFKKQFNIELNINNRNVWINIRLGESGYEITDYKNHEMQLCIYNVDGDYIGHELLLRETVNGNSYTIKYLIDNHRWERQEKGTYYRLGKNKLFDLTENFEANEESLYQNTINLFKNGFGIKLY